MFTLVSVLRDVRKKIKIKRIFMSGKSRINVKKVHSCS